MKKREIRLVLEICHQVDLLVSQDCGTSNLEVLERARLKMNDHLYKKRWLEAENMACAILLVHSGHKAENYLFEQGLN